MLNDEQTGPPPIEEKHPALTAIFNPSLKPFLLEVFGRSVLQIEAEGPNSKLGWGPQLQLLSLLKKGPKSQAPLVARHIPWGGRIGPAGSFPKSSWPVGLTSALLFS